MCNVNQDRVDRPEKAEKFVPEYRGNLRDHMIEIPRCIAQASGIRVFGRRIKSLVFTTDVAIIRNINADAVIAVYPFTPQPAITHAVLTAAEMPVFSGVGGGIMGVVPGVMGVAAFAPPLDEAGNSVKAQKALAFIAGHLNLNLFGTTRCVMAEKEPVEA